MKPENAKIKPARLRQRKRTSKQLVDLSEIFNSEILNKAKVEPVQVVDRTQSRYVVLSYEMYQHLLEYFSELEDTIWGKAAIEALNQSQMVGEGEFMSTLINLANGEA